MGVGDDETIQRIELTGKRCSFSRTYAANRPAQYSSDLGVFLKTLEENASLLLFETFIERLVHDINPAHELGRIEF